MQAYLNDHMDLGEERKVLKQQQQQQQQQLWRSKVHARWQGASSMPAARQKELIEEYIAELPPLPHGCPRRTQAKSPAMLFESLQRSSRVRLAPSAELPALTGVYVREAPNHHHSHQIGPHERVLEYAGWLLTTAEYLRFGYAVLTGVSVGCLFDDDDDDHDAITYVLLGDPTTLAAQIKCVRGLGVKQANVYLVLNRWAHQTDQGVGGDGGEKHSFTDALVTVHATKRVQSGDELWLDHGATYWEDMFLHCPHCLEFGADANDRMLLCDAKVSDAAGGECKRAWHQLCMQPCLVEVPEGAFVCDIHQHAHP
jgi:hypothetical protein